MGVGFGDGLRRTKEVGRWWDSQGKILLAMGVSFVKPIAFEDDKASDMGLGFAWVWVSHEKMGRGWSGDEVQRPEG